MCSSPLKWRPWGPSMALCLYTKAGHVCTVLHLPQLPKDLNILSSILLLWSCWFVKPWDIFIFVVVGPCSPSSLHHALFLKRDARGGPVPGKDNIELCGLLLHCLLPADLWPVQLKHTRPFAAASCGTPHILVDDTAGQIVGHYTCSSGLTLLDQNPHKRPLRHDWAEVPSPCTIFWNISNENNTKQTNIPRQKNKQI